MDSPGSRCLHTSAQGFTRFSVSAHLGAWIHPLPGFLAHRIFDSSVIIYSYSSTSYCNGEGRGFQPPPIILLTQLTKSFLDICWISLYCGAGFPSTPPAMRGAASRLFSALERAGFIPPAMRLRHHLPTLQRRVAVVLEFSDFYTAATQGCRSIVFGIPEIYTAAKPFSRSAMMSSMCSVPMERRMVFS